MGNTLSPLLPQNVTPLFQLLRHGLNTADLLYVQGLGPGCDIIAKPCFWQFEKQIRGVVVDVFAVLFEDVDGGLDLGCGRCLHGQT